MAPTREKDTNGTPILIASSPSFPRASRPAEKRLSFGLAASKPPPPELQVAIDGRTEQWINALGPRKDMPKVTIVNGRALPGPHPGEARALQQIANIAKPTDVYGK